MLIQLLLCLFNQISEACEFYTIGLHLSGPFHNSILIGKVIINQLVPLLLEPFQIILLLVKSMVVQDDQLALLAELFLLVKDDHFEFFFSFHVLFVEVLKLHLCLSNNHLLILYRLSP